MKKADNLRVSFRAPLQLGDTEDVTVGCRANNPDICKNNGIPDICSFERGWNVSDSIKGVEKAIS